MIWIKICLIYFDNLFIGIKKYLKRLIIVIRRLEKLSFLNVVFIKWFYVFNYFFSIYVD